MNMNVIVVVLLVALVAIGGIMLKYQTEDRNEKNAVQEKMDRAKNENDYKRLESLTKDVGRNLK